MSRVRLTSALPGPTIGRVDPGALDTVREAAALHRMAKVMMWATSPLVPGALVWVASGIPPSFLSGGVRWTLGVWLLLGILGAAVMVATRGDARSHASIHPGGGPWPLEPRRRLVALCSLAGVILLIALTFVVDTRVPAAVLGPDPARAVIESREYADASRRGDVDRARVRFEADGVSVSSWVVDPYTTLARNPEVVYDPAQTDRVMALEAWRSARSTLWLLPTASALTVACALVPLVSRWSRRRRFGGLKPEVPIRAVSRPGHAKLLTVSWQDGQSATYLDVHGLGDEIARRVRAEGRRVQLRTGTDRGGACDGTL